MFQTPHITCQGLCHGLQLLPLPVEGILYGCMKKCKDFFGHVLSRKADWLLFCMLRFGQLSVERVLYSNPKILLTMIHVFGNNPAAIGDES